jgi:hypothetical protein
MRPVFALGKKIMARYQHLPIYRAFYAFSREVYRIKIKLPKVLKHDLGSMLFVSSLRCLRCVVFANGSQKKLKPLQELLLEIEGIWALLRLLYDLKGISKGEFEALSIRLSEVGPQVNAWIRWEKDRLKSEKRSS